MTTWQRWMFALMAVLALGLVAACGDDDDDDTNVPGQTETADQNGDQATNTPDDDDDNNFPGGSGGDEEEYVATLCGAFNEFFASFSEIISNPENQDADESEALQLFEKPYQNMLDTMRDADPPGDISEFHDALIENLEKVLEAVRSGDQEAFDAVGEEEIPEPSPEVEQKYSAIADRTEECAETGLFGQE